MGLVEAWPDQCFYGHLVVLVLPDVFSDSHAFYGFERDSRLAYQYQHNFDFPRFANRPLHGLFSLRGQHDRKQKD